jgi:putative hydrolase of the HAD superfamily
MSGGAVTGSRPATGPRVVDVIRAVGFDLDDTLLDHQSAVDGAVLAMIERMGWPPLADDLALWRRLEREHYPRYVRGDLSFVEQRRERLAAFLAARGLDPDGVDLDGTFADYFALYRERWAPTTDAVEVLGRLRQQGLLIGILTNGPRELQAAKLDHLGLATLVDTLIAVDDLPSAKPHPDAFDALCAALGVGRTELLFVGDDLEVDAHGAADAGVAAVWLNRNGAVAQPPGEQITSLAELPELLEGR